MVVMEHVGEKHSGPDSLEKTLSDASTAQNEVNSHEAPENMSSKDAALAGFGVAGDSNNSALATRAGAGAIIMMTLIFGLLNL